MEIKDITKEATTISQDASFKDAVRLMIEAKTNTLLVTNEDGELVGEVSVSDLLDAIVPEYLNGDSIAANFASEEMFGEAVADTQEKSVQFFMSQDFNAVELDDGLMSVAAAAIAHQRVRIPVVDAHNHPIGIISRQGLKHIIAEYLNLKDSA